MRRWGRLRAWWLLVVATAGGAAVAGLTRSLPTTIAVAVVAAVTAVTGVMSRRGTEALDEGHRQVLDARDKLLRDRHGRPPRVKDVTDLVALGVHRAAATPDGPALPAFVPRDRSVEVEAALGAHPFVVIVGESTAGKSRLALEAVRVRLPEHRFLLPDPDDHTSILAARRAAAGLGPCVVWLDDLERYLGAGGLTSHVLRQIGVDNPEAVVVATIRTKARERYAGPDDGTGPEDRRPDRGVFDLAEEIRIDRRWSPTEIERARSSADPRIVVALAQADRFGIAEHLAAGPRLLARATNAWDPEGGHTRGAALVAAAIDARRAGWHGPLPEALLERLHEHHLAARGGALLRPEPWEAALTWATTPVFAVSSLLVPDEADPRSHRVFDYLVDAAEAGADPLPDTVWTLLLDEADAATSLDIGWEAGLRQREDIAYQAFRTALDGGVLVAAVALAYVVARTGVRRETRQAADLLRTTIAAAPDDVDPAELLELKSALSWWTGASGDAEEALGTAREIWHEARRAYGDDHEASLEAGLSVARWTGHTGDGAEAFAIASRILDQAVRHLGPAHTTTLNGRFEQAVWAGHDGDADRRLRLWRELDSDVTGLLGEYDPLTNDVRWNLAGATIRGGDAEAGIRLLESVVAGRKVIYGSEHPQTLAGRLQLAGETGVAGRPAEALAEAEHLVREGTWVLGDDHEITLYARYQVALWTARTGDPARAESLFAGLLTDMIRHLGPDHPATGDLREQLRRSPDFTVDYPLPASW
ncbi:tetratricopeptide repeat protein [Actinoallomurus iriomotensis]|uniref:tetratricopeptide repeat protein n=1 Tax=Actinoallomurus iriomotensis TaxID=478107 RepID=UPI002553F8F8|nr:tetratricopeptide repeat protein [Actinoallomurus iriomotensis]